MSKCASLLTAASINVQADITALYRYDPNSLWVSKNFDLLYETMNMVKELRNIEEYRCRILDVRKLSVYLMFFCLLAF